MKQKLFSLFDATLIRFLLVGVINTLIGCGTMFLLYNLAHWSYWFSSAANYVVGGIVSFFLNKYFTFKKKSWSWSETARFVLTVGICYFLAYGAAKPIVYSLLKGQTTAVRDNVSMFAGMCLYTGLNYLGQRFFAFQNQHEEE